MNLKSLSPYGFYIITPELTMKWYDKTDHADVEEKFQECLQQLPADADVVVVDFIY